MKRTLALLAISVLSIGGGPAAAQTAPAQTAESREPLVLVQGDAVVKRAPDRAWVTVTAESRAKSPAEAQKANAETMTAVLAKLRNAGLSKDAIQTRAYELQPEYDFNEGRQRLRGYLARNSVEVRVDDLSRTGEILDIAVNAGATSVGSVRFDLKDRSEAEGEALRLAVQDARRRADAAAAGAGMKVQRIVRIEEQHARVMPPPRPYAMESRISTMADAAPPVEPGELEIRADVTVVAEIR